MSRLQPSLTTHRALFCALLLLLGTTTNTKAQIVINEILPNGNVELKNIGTSMANGIWVLHNYVGSIGTSSTYTSRTLTHETKS